jgi:hypothetical protein
MFRNVISVGVLSLSAIGGVLQAADDSPLFSVPKLSGITIDGKADDWADKGFKVNLLADSGGKMQPSSNFNATFRLGWDEKGLLVLVNVKDDVAMEPAEKIFDIWKGDSIELFVSSKRGDANSYQAVIAPGLDAKYNELRMNLSDYRKDKKGKLEAEAKREKVDGGYVMEVLLPWKNLNIEAAENAELGFQFYANDTDKGEDRYQALWYPKSEAHQDANNMHRIKLAADPSPAVQLSASGAMVEDRGMVSIVAASELAGKSVKIKDGEKEIGKGKLDAEGGRATAKIKLDKPKDKEKGYGALEISVDDNAAATINITQPVAK